MKLTSRKSQAERRTPIEVRDVRCESNITVTQVGAHSFATDAHPFLELVIRIPLNPEDFDDTKKLRDRMYNLHKHAELLEFE